MVYYMEAIVNVSPWLIRDGDLGFSYLFTQLLMSVGRCSSSGLFFIFFINESIPIHTRRTK